MSKLASEDPYIKKEFHDAARDENLTLGDKIESGSYRKANYGESEREDGNEVVLFLHSCILSLDFFFALLTGLTVPFSTALSASSYFEIFVCTDPLQKVLLHDEDEIPNFRRRDDIFLTSNMCCTVS